jgi:hypothetical protein
MPAAHAIAAVAVARFPQTKPLNRGKLMVVRTHFNIVVEGAALGPGAAVRDSTNDSPPAIQREFDPRGTYIPRSYKLPQSRAASAQPSTHIRHNLPRAT